MKFSVNQKDLQQSLSYCQGVIEKRSTLPILSNVLIDASNSKLKITATDLDLIFINEIKNVEIVEEGKTTTTSSIMYDIIRKFSSGKKINFELTGENKIHLESEKSVFNLNCITATEFPLTDENFTGNEFIIKSKSILKLLNKCNLLVGTSANVSGDSSFTDPQECMKNVKNYDIFVDGGTITSKGESTIIEIENEKIHVIREGALKKEDIVI